MEKWGLPVAGCMIGILCATSIVGLEQKDLFLQAAFAWGLHGVLIGGCVVLMQRWITGGITSVMIGTICGIFGGMVSSGIADILFRSLNLPVGHDLTTFWGVLTNGSITGIPMGIVLSLIALWQANKLMPNTV